MAQAYHVAAIKSSAREGRPRMAPYHTVRVVVHHSKFRWLRGRSSCS